MPCIECYFFPVCFYFILVGSGVDVSNESDVKIDNTKDQYLSIDEQVKKKNPGYLFYVVINKQGEQPPLGTYGFKVFQNLLFCNIWFNCLLSIGRVTLSNACSILVT
jgi:hypothetical protein